MDTTSLIVAVLGVVLGALSLGWQAATHVLTGGRAKVVLRVGGMNPGGGTVSTEPSNLSARWTESAAEQGFTRLVVVVRVANIGRLPVTVASWGLQSTLGVSYYPVADSLGPSLPHRLDVGESESWAVDLAHVRAFLHSSEEVLGNRPRATSLIGAAVEAYRDGRYGRGTRAVVELADGRTVRSADALR